MFRRIGLGLAVALVAGCGGSSAATPGGKGGAAGASPRASASGTGGQVFIGSMGSAPTCGDAPLLDGTGCEGAGGAGGGAGGGKPLTFARDVAPIVNGCTGELCHVWSYDGLVRQPAIECCDHRDLVNPGDENHSYLLAKLTGQGICYGSSMPPNGRLDAQSITTIRAWICAGAPRE